MGILRAVQTLPTLLFGLVIGAVVDRLPHRPIMVWSDIGRALALGLVPLAAAFDFLSIELLFFVGFIVGTLRLSFDVAYFSFLPALVEQQELLEGNSKLELSSSVAQVVGPPFGGLLIQALTAPLAITLDALSFVVSALYLSRVRTDEARSSGREQRQSLLAEIAEGLRFVFGTATLRALALATATFNLGLGVIFTLQVLFLSRSLGLSPVIIGLVSAAIGPGFLLGAIFVGPLTDRFGIGLAVIGAQFLGGAIWLVTPFAGGSWLAVLVLGGVNLLSGVTGQVAMINHLSLRQQLTPGHLVGRTNATMRSSPGAPPRSPPWRVAWWARSPVCALASSSGRPWRRCRRSGLSPLRFAACEGPEFLNGIGDEEMVYPLGVGEVSDKTRKARGDVSR